MKEDYPLSYWLIEHDYELYQALLDLYERGVSLDKIIALFEEFEAAGLDTEDDGVEFEIFDEEDEKKLFEYLKSSLNDLHD